MKEAGSWTESNHWPDIKPLSYFLRGAEVGFAVTDRLRREMLHRTGLGELLPNLPCQSNTVAHATPLQPEAGLRLDLIGPTTKGKAMSDASVSP
ncbi:hypothetical protein GOC53_27010 [Sinorhizobium medicae]|nr:hypothetical protein [Sinorhizobium medicae]MDX0455985.1 hypothetical protein [Sinorhizobium medicae]MDX0493891.1 hypothetical protein [Sinorhizobium medicae]MDX0506127.1 hypothetical protein [Sinorhizobium medicae]MDX0524389.1 hypothetical protein [Sinorhizobium medicae]